SDETISSMMRDITEVENLNKLVITSIRAARNIARQDLSHTSILWIDEPYENLAEKAYIGDRLAKIGVELLGTEEGEEALQKLRDRKFNVVISDYGRDRCVKGDTKRPRAECVLDGMKKLSYRPPLLIYSTGVTAKYADEWKCKGAVTATHDPNLLFVWLVRA